MPTNPIYKSAIELGIEDWEREGLVLMVDLLGRGKIKLNMKMTMYGTIGCIGGHVAVSAGVEPHGYVGDFRPANEHVLIGGQRSNTALAQLYYPGGDGARVHRHPGWDATSDQAAQAVINYLVTGEAQWDSVMMA